ncbi:hypothetical protein [Actinacidiphila sp. ITFR-21]|uniref:hypothetical protein n=1 Tax=Actinacidiphila sp. ITFR-21 TaxID=3075199 RepID=UPI00288B0271|nr:hypothetical protein [Streptomyces sp. ITFR-21]WNI16946.1 hypothetical protein RLT57_16380 [Streptomyces sp. ITFR-21]
MPHVPTAPRATPSQNNQPEATAETEPITARIATLEADRAAARAAVDAATARIVKRIEGAPDPVLAADLFAERFTAGAAKILAENNAEIQRIAAALGAVIVEVDPAKKPAALSDVDIVGWYDADPEPCLLFPAGQRIGERLTAARQIAAELGVTA